VKRRKDIDDMMSNIVGGILMGALILGALLG